jgi:hypothetical protein
MLTANLNVEQARPSNVKRNQPNPKCASNLHFTEFSELDYLSELWLITLATINHGHHRY